MRRFAVVALVSVATLFGLVVPAGAGQPSPGWHVTLADPTQQPLFSVSCASDRYCLGLGINSSGEVWNGTLWTATQTAPLSYDVSCPAARDCMVAGVRLASPGDPRDAYETPLVAHWDGRTYTTMAIPIDPLAPGRASSVSCPASNACMVAAGPILLRWDGLAWTQTAVPQTSAGAPWLYDVTCTQADQCVAVGVDPAGNPAAVAWNGTTWTSSPAPSFAPLQVACESSDWCMAVGSTTFYGGNFGNLDSAAVWNGSTWTPVAVADHGVTGSTNVLSCAGPDSCAFVTESLREHWDGNTWTLSPAPRHGPGSLTAVDCPNATTCLGVGYQPFPGGTIRAYAERWTAG